MSFNKFVSKIINDFIEVSSYKVPLYYFPFTVSIYYAPRETIMLMTSIWLYNSLVENEKKSNDDGESSLSDNDSIDYNFETTLNDENIEEDEISSINSENEIDENLEYEDQSQNKENEESSSDEITNSSIDKSENMFYNLSDDEKLDEKSINSETKDNSDLDSIEDSLLVDEEETFIENKGFLSYIFRTRPKLD